MSVSDHLTHLDSTGKASMVDVGAKPETAREASVTSFVSMEKATLELIREAKAKKGDVIATARIAGIMAAKKTSDLIPLCHPIAIDSVKLDFELVDEDERCGVAISATARTTGKTGIEMEALTAASVAGLTIYDMCKAVDRGMIIGDIQLEHKSGGASGSYRRES